MHIIDSKVHEMKNRIINFLLPVASEKTKKIIHTCPQQGLVDDLNVNK